MNRKYVSDNPKLMKEWDFQKNSINPNKVTLFSSKKRWWICENGYDNHSYESVVADKYRDQSGCPYCSNRKVLKGFNDLATTRKDLLLDWDFDNNSKTPYEITAGSSYPANWVCHVCGYKWKAAVSSRSKGNGCKECAKKKRVETANNLRVKRRGSFVKKYPELLLDYDYETNPSPDTLTSGSKQPIKWICHVCGKRWNAPLYSRCAGGQGCPDCAKALFKESINRVNLNKIGSLADKCTELLLEWDYSRNDEDPSKLPYTSHKQVWWKCSKCGRKWKNTIRNRTIFKQGCICGAGKRISKKVRESYLAKNGSLRDNYPVVLKEWDYEKNADIGLTPDNVSPFSQQKVHWHCPKCGHEWEQIIAQKTAGMSLCPNCTRESKTSFPEQTIFFYLKQCTFAQNRAKVYGFEVDIFLPKFNIGVEYDGMRFHKEKKLSYDQRKDAELLSKGIKVIRVKEYKGAKPNDKYCVNANNYVNSLNEVISMLTSDLGFAIDVDVKRDEQRIYEQYISIPKTNSLTNKYPEIAKEWNYDKNGNIKPEMISYGSKKEFWWKCSKCGAEFIAAVQLRTSGKGGHCPNCWVRKKGGRPKK